MLFAAEWENIRQWVNNQNGNWLHAVVFKILRLSGTSWALSKILWSEERSIHPHQALVWTQMAADK